MVAAFATAREAQRTLEDSGLRVRAVVTVAVLAADAMFALDSVPAVYGITGDPYLVFVTNAFALLGLRALYFLVEGVLGRLVHLGYGLAVILAFIGYKLIAHWAHDVWHWVWTPSTAVSIGSVTCGSPGKIEGTSAKKRSARCGSSSRLTTTCPTYS